MAKVRSVILLVFTLLGSTTGQVAHMRLTGVITDSTGASLSGARVLLVDLATLDTQKIQVGLDGGFQFDVKPGDYAVIAAAPSDTPCWKPAVRQVRTADGAGVPMRIPLILDTEKCAKIVE